MRILLTAGLIGCARYETPFSVEIPSNGLTEVSAQLESGDFSYGVEQEDYLIVQGLSHGRGMSKQRAKERELGNSYRIEAIENRLDIDGYSEFSSAGIDFDVLGPSMIDLTVDTLRGSVNLWDVEGIHQIYANSVTTQRVIGSLDIDASSSVDAEVWPYVDGYIDIDVESGPCTLRLPAGGNYDIQVWGTAEYAMSIEDLGFQQEFFGEGYYAAISGSGDVHVTVQVHEGEFTLLESY